MKDNYHLLELAPQMCRSTLERDIWFRRVMDTEEGLAKSDTSELTPPKAGI